MCIRATNGRDTRINHHKKSEQIIQSFSRLNIVRLTSCAWRVDAETRACPPRPLSTWVAWRVLVLSHSVWVRVHLCEYKCVRVRECVSACVYVYVYERCICTWMCICTRLCLCSVSVSVAPCCVVSIYVCACMPAFIHIRIAQRVIFVHKTPWCLWSRCPSSPLSAAAVDAPFL